MKKCTLTTNSDSIQALNLKTLCQIEISLVLLKHKNLNLKFNPFWIVNLLITNKHSKGMTVPWGTVTVRVRWVAEYEVVTTNNLFQKL